MGMGGCYKIEAWQSGGAIGSYCSKLEMSAFIGTGTGPAGLVWLNHYFQGKMKFHFCKKQLINSSASVMLGLVRLIISLYNKEKEHMNMHNII